MSYSDLSPEIENLLLSINRKFKDEFSLTLDVIERLKKCFDQFSFNDANQRIRNAFNFFFNSWHVEQIDQCCINLAVVLETLFSPSENAELNFRIAFNTASFLGNSKVEKDNIFKIIKKFYNIRSAIIHGGEADFVETNIYSSVVFLLCAECLEKLGLDETLSIKICNRKHRDELFSSWLFPN